MASPAPLLLAAVGLADAGGQAAAGSARLQGRPLAQRRGRPQVRPQCWGQSAFTWGGYAQAIGILFLLLGVLWLAVWLARRFGKFNFLPRPGALPRGALVMEAQLPLGPRKGLMVVRFLNKRLLLGVTDQRITLLSEEEAHHEPPENPFQQVMDKAPSRR